MIAAMPSYAIASCRHFRLPCAEFSAFAAAIEVVDCFEMMLPFAFRDKTLIMPLTTLIMIAARYFAADAAFFFYAACR
jgi:hypothetical protein